MMLSELRPQPMDKIIKLLQEFKDDPRSEKTDLGVGVYRDASGLTPVMRAVKTAEKRLWESEDTKSYTGLAGDPGYQEAMREMVLGGAVPSGRVAAAHTPGGTGAVRQALELVKLASPDASVWISSPSWPNHKSIATYLSMPAHDYRYFDYESRAVDFEGMISDLSAARAGDAVILHGCCHNPTGANLTQAQWSDVASLLLDVGAIPLIDIAYQGFGEGLEEDASGVRHIASALPESLIAASCSKNFGIYRERAGILLAIVGEADSKGVVQGNLAYLNRQNFSFPPDHGARLVTMILRDEALKSEWIKELDEIRESMLGLRVQLAGELRRRSGSDRHSFIAAHRGMFSLLGGTPEQVQTIRDRHGVYMVGDSRINIAGLNKDSVPKLAEAMLDVGM